MAKIYKTYFEDIVAVHHAFSKIAMFKGVFLLRDAYAVKNDSDLDKVGRIILLDDSVVHIMDSESFDNINRNGEISFDWSEIYFFEGQSLEECKNIYLRPKKASIKKSDLLIYFKQQCDFWAASIDGQKMWLMSSNIASIQSIFQSYSNKFEEQKGLSFFNMVCNDLLFST